jgi:hypothetical protein
MVNTHLKIAQTVKPAQRSNRSEIPKPKKRAREGNKLKEES